MPESVQPALSDAPQRDLIRTALNSTLVVEAAAGTGKTTELVRRIVALLCAGRAQLDRMVAVTFTEPAAGELKLRLRAAIELARLESARPLAQRECLNAALPKLEEARVGTIHGFCADLLREYPVQTGVDPRFEVAAEDIAWTLFNRVFERWFEGQLANPGPAVRRILRRRKREYFGSRPRDEGPRGLLRHAAWQLIEHRDFPGRWRADASFQRDPIIDAIFAEVQSLAAWAPRCDPEDWFGKSLIELAKVAQELQRAERERDRDYDGLEAWIGELVSKKHWQWKGWSRPEDPEFPRGELLHRRDELQGLLKRFLDESGADLAPHLRDELWPVVEDYRSAKEGAGCLDFNDLLIHTRNLIRDDAAVRRALQNRFTHYFVDEFQDTDPLQVEILMLLGADDPEIADWRKARAAPGKLFFVGDPKQSIYRFRRADVGLYREVQQRLLAQGATRVNLTVSFRSVPAIQEAVNAAFAPRFQAIEGAYVPLAPFRASCDSQPAVIALPVPAPYSEYGKVVNWKIDESLPDVVAAWIDWLVKHSGWTVTEREHPGVRVSVEPRHVCLIFKRLQSFGDDVTRPYVDALEARQLPHLRVGGSSFHGREEIEVVRTALTAIERPDDELAVFATLHGPLLAVSDAALLLWRERIGPLNPFRAATEGLTPSLAEIAEALKLLRELHRHRNQRPVADTISQLLEATRAHAAFAIWPTGAQALANIARLMVLSRRAEQQGLVSFRSFVERLESDAERRETAEAPLFEEGVQGVRIMSGHKAKGLEFPIVVLADMTAREAPDQASRWTDATRGLCVQRIAGCTPPELREHSAEEIERERAEALRVLYVATTRARDILVVPVIGDARLDGWVAALNPVVHPDAQHSRQPIAHQAPGTPVFGNDSTPIRPTKAKRPRDSVMPGLHQPESGPHRVVWWDPSVLGLNVPPSVGLSQTRILQEDGTNRAQETMAHWEAWRAARGVILERGAKPSMVVQTATQWARGANEVAGASDVSIVDAQWKGERLTGPRFGTLVHALLAAIDLDAERDHVMAHAETYARMFGADERERDGAVEVVVAALTHPLLRRAATAARAGRCRRESPLVVRLEDGTLLESIADLAFFEAEEWIVVDFKTDAELGAREQTYRRQVALYVRGITEATSATARGHLLLV
jgi:ATP-dependent exoDNAse (exonuclease V) beta subunit